jgi:hypothetical protein
VKPDAAELQMFARLASEPKFREYLVKQLDNEYDIFVTALDKDFLAKAQGRAGLLRSLIKRLDEARKAS